MLPSHTSETWKSVPGYEGHYEVSDFGRVRTLKYSKSDPVLSAIVHPKTGYLQVQLWKAQSPRTWLVHQLVASAFLGARPHGLQVRHLDGDRANARLDNLKYGTPKENCADKVLHGTSQRGDKHPRVRVSDSQVQSIKTRYLGGERMVDLASEFGVSLSSVKNYISGARKSFI